MAYSSYEKKEPFGFQRQALRQLVNNEKISIPRRAESLKVQSTRLPQFEIERMSILRRTCSCVDQSSVRPEIGSLASTLRKMSRLPPLRIDSLASTHLRKSKSHKDESSRLRGPGMDSPASDLRTPIANKEKGDVIVETLLSNRKYHLDCFRIQILTYKTKTFQRYTHYRGIVENLARGINKKFGIDEGLLLPKDCGVNPKFAIAMCQESTFEHDIIKDFPVAITDCTLEQAIETVDCLVVLSESELPDVERMKQYKYLKKQVCTFNDKRDGFRTVIFIMPRAEKKVNGNVNSREICFVRANEDKKQIKSLIASSIERRLLLSLENFNVGSIKDMMKEDQELLKMEINAHSSSIRKVSVLFKEERNIPHKDAQRCFPTALEQVIERHKTGIHTYGVFFQDFILYIDETYKFVEEMRHDLQQLDKESKLRCFRKIILITTTRVDPEPLRFCGKTLYHEENERSCSGTLGGLAVTINSKSNQKADVGISCYHVTEHASDWFIRSDTTFQKLGEVVERSDCWITKENDEIYCDLSLIKLDKEIIELIERKKEEFYYLSLRRNEHSMARILGIENPLYLQPTERHVYRAMLDCTRQRNAESATRFIQGIILGYMWRPSEQMSDKKLRSIVIAKSISDSLLDGVKARFAERGDSGSLVFSSDFDEEGDEILYVRAMVTHGYVGEEDPNIKKGVDKGTKGKLLKDVEVLYTRNPLETRPKYDEQSLDKSSEKNENAGQETEEESSAESMPSGFIFEVPENDVRDYRLYTYCMEMDKANEKLKQVTDKYLVFDMNEFGKRRNDV